MYNCMPTTFAGASLYHGQNRLLNYFIAAFSYHTEQAGQADQSGQSRLSTSFASGG
jgi:hypothetical protein